MGLCVKMCLILYLYFAGGNLSYGAAKSRYGHAETGAGAVGLLAAISMQENQLQAPILHLRNINTYVSGIFETSANEKASLDGELRPH